MATAKVIATCLIISISMQMCCSSAIPIWELLTRNEKMSYLYSTFAQLVSVHCKATAATSTVPVNQCKRNLLAYGYDKLQTFSNEQLDLYDPYQRGASELIWSSIMRDHPSSTLITTRKPTIPTPPATSIIILTHQKPARPSSNDGKITASTEISSKTSSSSSSSSSNSQKYAENPIFETAIDNSHKYAMDMDIAYGYAEKHDYNPAQVEVFDLPQEEPRQDQDHDQDQQTTEEKKDETFLTGGPLIVRVRPDGTPVDEDDNDKLPITDDDRDGFYVNTEVLQPPKIEPEPEPVPSSQVVHAAAGRPTKHRKIATITALKQQFLKNLAVQRQLQAHAAAAAEEPAQDLLPPMERQRIRRHYRATSPAFNVYYST